jgi:hypothetical protein
MKRFLLFVLLLASLAPAFGQYMSHSQLAHSVPGFIRKAPCGNGAGDNCGTNPPTWHLTPAACGIMISTGAAKNADGSSSTRGIRYTLPTVAEFTAAGMGSGSGAPGNTGYDNRDAQCEISFVMGAPGPDNWMEVGFADDAVPLVDKFTPFGQGAFDIANGFVRIPYRTPGVITFAWNSNSWLAKAATPALAEMLQMGQLSTHGQARLIQVSADPSWWSVGTNVGKLALCPVNGSGMVANTNGGFGLNTWPYCVYRDNVSTTSVTDLIVLRNIVSGTVTCHHPGRSVRCWHAQNGESYGAGNYIVAITATAINLSSGATWWSSTTRRANSAPCWRAGGSSSRSPRATPAALRRRASSCTSASTRARRPATSR